MRPRSANKNSTLKLGKKELGDKKSKIILNQLGSTTEHKMTEEESQKYCLTDEISLKLGHVAIQIEKELGDFKPIDIEWAIDQVAWVEAQLSTLKSIYVIRINKHNLYSTWNV